MGDVVDEVVVVVVEDDDGGKVSGGWVSSGQAPFMETVTQALQEAAESTKQTFASVGSNTADNLDPALERVASEWLHFALLHASLFVVLFLLGFAAVLVYHRCVAGGVNTGVGTTNASRTRVRKKMQ